MEKINPIKLSTPSTPKVPVIVKKLPISPFFIIGGVAIVAIGVLLGYFLSGGRAGKSLGVSNVPQAVNTKNEAGISDEKTFSDTATGLLEEGGISGEGTHHLTRPGGPSQTVYLTSTVIDLQSFVGKNIQVWGQTISARKAGWLMDVGKVKVIE